MAGPDSAPQPDDNLETLDSLKANVKTAMADLPHGTEITKPEFKLKVNKQYGGVSVNTYFTDQSLGGQIFAIAPDGTITSYLVMPRDLGRNGSFGINEDTYRTLLSALAN